MLYSLFSSCSLSIAKKVKVFNKYLKMTILKKVVLFNSLLFALQTQATLTAQIKDQDNVHFNAILDKVYNLVIKDGNFQLATFNTATDYDFGVSESTGAPGIDPGFTTVAMEATGNWFLDISAPDFSPVTGSGSIPINNLGVWCEATGTHQFGTEVTCAYQSPDAAWGLTTSDKTLIDIGTGNGGDQTDNLFILHWLMGTMQGNMNTASMFLQLATGVFTIGTYNTTIVLTLKGLP
jgi:hypothetical protein